MAAFNNIRVNQIDLCIDSRHGKLCLKGLHQYLLETFGLIITVFQISFKGRVSTGSFQDGSVDVGLPTPSRVSH